MRLLSLSSGTLPILLAAALAGCAPASEQKGGGAFDAANARTYGADERRIAARLSLGNGSELNSDDSPYTQAVMCRAAFDSVAERLQQTGALGADQVRAMETAKGLFESRLASLARAAGKSEQTVASDLRERAAQSDAAASARVLVGCLRRLEEDARR
ncbi:MAG: hypothetical protein ACEQR8_00790 [Cypionkella sp.]